MKYKTKSFSCCHSKLMGKNDGKPGIEKISETLVASEDIEMREQPV